MRGLRWPWPLGLATGLALLGVGCGAAGDAALVFPIDARGGSSREADGRGGATISIQAAQGAVIIGRSGSAPTFPPALTLAGPILRVDGGMDLLSAVQAGPWSSLDVRAGGAILVDSTASGDLTIAGDARVAGRFIAERQNGDARKSLNLSIGGTLWIDGSIDLSGEGASGDARSITMTVAGDVYLTGPVLAQGGDARDPGAGGNGAAISITSSGGSIYLLRDGAVVTRGGRARGGSNGGGAGNITLSAPTGEIRLLGVDHVAADGGESGDATANGGTVTITAGLALGIGPGVTLSAAGGPSRSLANAAGRGGTLTLVAGTAANPSALEIEGGLDARGGDGFESGGAGGTVTLGNATGTDTIDIEGSVGASGGEGGTGNGGAGGTIAMTTIASRLVAIPGRAAADGDDGGAGGTVTINPGAAGTTRVDGRLTALPGGTITITGTLTGSGVVDPP